MTRRFFDTTDAAISAFRRRIEAGAAGFLLSNTPVCPKTDSRENFVAHYTFTVDDLLSGIGTQVIVHHGVLPEQITQRVHLLYYASPIIYAHRALGQVSLTLSQIREMIEGRITDWGVLHNDKASIRLFRHTGNVQGQVFNAVATELFGARQIRGDFSGSGTYEGLAAQASTHHSSLVFGLRPKYAPSELRPVSIDGKWPGTPANIHEYPFLPVWLSVPHGRSEVDLARYLNLVASRMERDVLGLRTQSELPLKVA